jgi:very-short-patch-repair endonuclease
MHLRKRQALGCKFRRQYSVDHSLIDFYCPELKLAVELDGNVHEIPDRRIMIRQDKEFLGNPNKAFLKIENAIKELSKNNTAF